MKPFLSVEISSGEKELEPFSDVEYSGVMAELTDSEIIDVLGGTTAVAHLCKVVPSAVSMWRQDGIPPARRFWIATQLRAKGKRVPRNFYERNALVPKVAGE